MVMIGQVELRVLLGLSMLFQALIFIWTYFRKRSSSYPVLRIFGLICYLAADFVAARSLANIFQSKVNPRPNQTASNKHLLAFWAQLIVLHLGGHSKLAAFSLEDNEVWLRHLLGFLFHETIALIVCAPIIVTSLIDNYKNILPWLLILSFVTGSIKLGERVWALKRGSLTGLRSHAHKKSSSAISVRNLKLESNRSGHVINPGPFDDDIEKGGPVDNIDPDLKLLCRAYYSFENHKGLYIDNIWSSNFSRDTAKFRESSVGACIKQMQAELGFAYDLFYSKRIVLHTKCGSFLQATSIILIVVSIILFSGIDDAYLRLDNCDKGITYVLLSLALLLELFSFGENVFSNHTMVHLASMEWRRLTKAMVRIRTFVGRPLINISSSRWLFKIGQYSLLEFCFGDYRYYGWLKRVLDFVEIKKFVDNYRYISYNTIDDDFKTLIFEQVKTFLTNYQASHLAPVRSSTLRQMSENIYNLRTTKTGFEKCLLTWHIATTLCDDENIDLRNAKVLSEYMLYLLAEQPSILSTVVPLEQKNFQDVRKTTVNLLTTWKLSKTDASSKILNDYRTLDSVLSDGASLASELMNCKEEKDGFWGLLLNVWIDMLAYAAIHSKGKHHVERLGTGGEFITLVWLYMVHLGLHSNFQLIFLDLVKEKE